MCKPAVYIYASIILFLICIGARCAFVQYDPPSWLSWSSGLYTDEGFYSLDARTETYPISFLTSPPETGREGIRGGTGKSNDTVIFAQTSGAAGDFHDRYGAPLLSAIQCLWFRCFGCTLTQARLISVVFGILTIVALWIALYLHSGIKAAFAGALFLGLAPPVVFYNAMGLQETPAAFFLTASLCLIVAAWSCQKVGRQCIYAVIAGILLICAYTCKSLAIVALPGLYITGITGLWIYTQPSNKKRIHISFVAGIFAAGLVYLAVSWLPHHREISQMGRYYLTHQVLPHKISTIYWNIRRAFIVHDQGVIAFLLGMLPIPFALVLTRLRSAGVRRDAAIWVWLGCGIAFCMLSNYSPSRYYILIMPALCWIAALQWCAFNRQIRRATTAIFLIGFAFWYGSAWMHRETTVAQAQRLVQSSIPENSMLVGDLAPQLTLGSKIKSTLMIPGLANDNRPVERLDADYIVMVRSKFWITWWQSHYPELINPDHLYRTIYLGPRNKYIVDIYKVHD